MVMVMWGNGGGIYSRLAAVTGAEGWEREDGEACMCLTLQFQLRLEKKKEEEEEERKITQIHMDGLHILRCGGGHFPLFYCGLVTFSKRRRGK